MKKENEETIKKKVDSLEEAEVDKKLDVSGEGKSILEQLLNAKSPQKELSEYRDHILNFDKSDSTSRILRGVEGLLGNLDRAVLDVAIGIIQKVFKGSKNEG